MSEIHNSDQETELTMCDVLQEEQELEEDANAVLGGSDDTNCSYEKGYVPRQALYACMTCCKSGDAGVCLACCYSCHDGHEVVELYTKRNFRCDCGNSKFGDKSCMLKVDKDPVNANNSYNQNFKGLYCTCNRPYPDPEDDVSDEMIQCVCCEDWYHGRHLKTKVPEDYYEMICFKCMGSHKFLYNYLNAYNRVKVQEGTDAEIHAPTTSTSPSKCASIKPELTCNGTVTKIESTFKEETVDVVNNVSVKKEPDVVNDVSMKKEPESSIKKEHCDEASSSNGSKVAAPSNECGFPEGCILKRFETISPDGSTTSGSAFWPCNWRRDLCRCVDCMAMYVQTGCEFLLNPEDTIQAYEEKGKGGARESQYDKGLSALSQLDRVKQMEAVRAYTSMKGELKKYLQEFADNKKTVCESDIKEFFERMSKKQKLNNGVPHYCR